MKSIFILIRGNSGSGKTVLANELQKLFGYKECLVLYQDNIRRDILHANDHIGTPAVDLIQTLVSFGESHYKIIILEGILRKDVYEEMLLKLIKKFDNQAYVYYLDESFNNTVKYNQMKNEPFSTIDLKKWWRGNDYLNYKEQRLSSGNTQVFSEKIMLDIVQNDTI